MAAAQPPVSSAEEGYLLLADISGYTNFMGGVGESHGVDFSEGIPLGFAMMGALLDAVADALGDPFTIVKFEGDAVFATAPTATLDGRGPALLQILRAAYVAFIAARTRADVTRGDHECDACLLVTSLDLKMVLHEGTYVSQAVHGQTELLGNSVNVAHRLLKSTVAETVGHRHFLHLTDAAAERLELADAGVAHLETYDLGNVPGRVLDLTA
jgi:class 3 adenylate cyclase